MQVKQPLRPGLSGQLISFAVTNLVTSLFVSWETPEGADRLLLYEGSIPRSAEAEAFQTPTGLRRSKFKEEKE